MAESRETAYSYYAGESTGLVSTNEQRIINKVHRLKEKYPDEVTIQDINSDGSLVAQVPSNWIKLSPKRVMSEEQKAAAAERMKEYQANKK